ncbi:MAG: hypothetical protein IPK95_09645 [Cellvibrionales bacterium]|nr:hypothetical protein [Cellvibrionales bacterium]
MNAPLSSDDALFLSVPKNWINGYGWATSYSEKIPFNPDFTGPTALLIPAALLIKLFGNPLWIAGVTGAVINLALLALCMQQVRAYWRNSGIAALYLVCGCIISKPNDFASLIGYYSGSLLFLLTALLAFNPLYSTQKKALGIGLLAAIGLHIKLLLAPAFAILGFLFLLRQYAKNTISFMQSPGLLILMLLPVLLLQGSWQLYRQQSLSTYSNEYVATHQQYADNFSAFMDQESANGRNRQIKHCIWKEIQIKISISLKSHWQNTASRILCSATPLQMSSILSPGCYLFP